MGLIYLLIMLLCIKKRLKISYFCFLNVVNFFFKPLDIEKLKIFIFLYDKFSSFFNTDYSSFRTGRTL